MSLFNPISRTEIMKPSLNWKLRKFYKKFALGSIWHMCDVVHHDLKPGNILLMENRDVKLADFGLAKELGM
jgi:serine/threonine protein kinase